MTNEELDKARAKEAWSDHYKGDGRDPTVIAARLAREGWMPPAPVDPDLAEAEKVWDEFNGPASDGETSIDLALAGIKRGRALAAEAKSGMVWVKHDGSDESPVNKNGFVAIFRRGEVNAGRAKLVDWRVITHYAVITSPEDVA